MGAVIRSLDWSRTAVGPIESWPQSLRTALSILLSSRHPICLWWGRELVQFYNDSYRSILGPNKHPNAMGQTARACWPEIWHVIEPMIDKVWSGGSTYVEDGLLCLDRHGFREECYFNYSYSPIRDESGAVGGVFVACSESTQRVVGGRRLETLRRLAARTSGAGSIDEAMAAIGPTLSAAAPDLPFSLVYLAGDDGRCRLLEATGIAAGRPAAPTVIEPDDSEPWPLCRARERPITVDLPSLAGTDELPGRPWPERPRRARVLALPSPDLDAPLGYLVAGVSPRLELDDAYVGFFDLVATHLGAAIGNARARRRERQRAEALADLDRAKTRFFHNVSHEFRTPLTLLLAPLDDDNDITGRDIEVMRSNALRLLRMVDTMLDFARIEAGSLEPCFQRVDAGQLTAELAEQFRSLFEEARLELTVDCPSPAAEVYLDRDLWEKLVFNLLSNAFKFTFEGRVHVALRERAGAIQLRVSDTGVGIPEHELPRLFERFHQVRDTRARSYEGTGIGLAFVAELARLHGGRVEVESRLGAGSTFAVTVPTGAAHLPLDRVEAAPPASRSRVGAGRFVEEARRWSPIGAGSGDFDAEAPTAGGGERVLVVDDNRDLRDYVSNTLSAVGLDVLTAPDGSSALEAIARHPIDLVIADAMMPGGSGIELLERLRADPETAGLPVILLSARAGERAKLEGLASGAEDYLVKPFSPRELIARARIQLGLARERHQLQSERNRLERLLDAGKAMVAELDEARLAQIITDQATRAVEAQLGAFFSRSRSSSEAMALYALCGAPPSAFAGLPAPRITELFEPTLRGGGIVRLDDVRLDGRFGKNAPHNGLPEGHLPVVSYMAAPVVSPDGEVLGGLFLSHQDAGHFTAEHESLLAGLAPYAGIAMSNARLYRDLLETERRKDEFLAMLGHELRNPLAPIASAAELLSNAEAETETTGRLAGIIARQARQLARLVDDLLDASRIARGIIPISLERIGIDGVIEQAVAEVTPVIEERGHTLRVEVPPGIEIEGDPGRLVQVFSNLLNNAARYTQPGGWIDLSVRRHQGKVAVVIRDGGIGISEELLPRVFELFTRGAPTLDPSDPGLGVGLTLVKQLVEGHGGTVHASSEGPGRGSEFTVLLDDVFAEESGDDHAAAHDNGGNHRRVLVVDDNVDAADMLAMLIETMGGHAIVAYDGPTAIELADKLAPDLVILDIGLPGMSGIDVARALRAQGDNGRARIVALTGYGHAGLRVDLDEAGFSEHLLKPLDPERLRQLLEAE